MAGYVVGFARGSSFHLYEDEQGVPIGYRDRLQAFRQSGHFGHVYRVGQVWDDGETGFVRLVLKVASEAAEQAGRQAPKTVLLKLPQINSDSQS